MRSHTIYLRLLEEADLYLRPKWFNDDQVRMSLMMDYPISLAMTKLWYKRSLLDDSKKNFSICLNENDQVIGMAGYLNIDRVHHRAQFYITIGEKEYWGKHIAHEVIPLLLKYGFEDLNLHKIYLYTLGINKKARHIYEEFGFLQEGLMEEHCYYHGQYHDLHQHGLLKKTWQKNH